MESRNARLAGLELGPFLQLRTIHLRISGRVQGVGYREAMHREADRLGVTGWVRNRTDGTVEALVQGAGEALEAMVAWARRGPAAARVEQVDAEPAAAAQQRVYARFERWPTV